MIGLSRGKIKDLTGQRFGRLVVLSDTGQRVHRHVVWECLCDCGTKCLVPSGSLASGRTRSCGCFLKESRGVARTTHHMSQEKIYSAWQGMRKRCSKPYHKDFERYGGRGIRVCQGWDNNFQAFFDYVSLLPHFGEKGYTLDRINNDGNYEPGNVRWATQKEQMNNTRKQNRREVLPE